MSTFLWQMGLALLLTLAMESAAALLFRPRGRMALAFALGSLATNPLLNICLLLTDGSAVVLCLGEVFAVGLEAWICRSLTGVSARRALALSAALNALSYTLGKLIF